MTGESTPRLDDLDDGWADDPSGDSVGDDDAELDAAWGADEDDEPQGPPVPGAPPRERKPKKQRPKRAPRDVRQERLRGTEQKKAELRAEKQKQILAKQKAKQPREKKPPRTEPTKKELRRQRQVEESAIAVARYDEDPDLSLDAAAAKRRGGSLQDALKSNKGSSSGVPSWVGYVVLALLVGGAALYLLLR